jgi:hypothetical protein
VGVLAHLVLTQIMAFFRGGYPVCRYMGWEKIPSEAYREINAITSEGICRILDLPGVDKGE